jgi:hypothetical protein
MIRTTGRSGSNWLLTLLCSHPRIVAYRTFQFEPSLANYWMHILRTLAEPSSYMQSILMQAYDEHWWIGDRRPGPLPPRLGDNEMPRWLGSDNVEALAAMFQERLDAFYQRLDSERETEARYFVEKALPRYTLGLIGELYPEARELLLIRDFRDMVCSIVDYNAKRGLALWGRDKAADETAWYRLLRADVDEMLTGWRGRAHLVRYEDLVLDPEPTLAGVFSHIDVEADMDTVQRVIAAAQATRPRAQSTHRTSSSVEESVGRWRRDLTPEQQAACEEVFEDVLLQFGYPPTRER